jgi:hypothetical protein
MVMGQQNIVDYGVYCGLYHTDVYGEQPINDLDRKCQVHDICVSALGRSSCYCNEQLYWAVSNVKPIDKASDSEKNKILSLIYPSLVSCNNYYDFDIKFVLANGYITTNRGFNYVPFYSVPDKLDERLYFYSSDDIYIFSVDNKYYSNLTHQIYDSITTPVKDYSPVLCKKNQQYYLNRDQRSIIFYSTNQKSTSVYVTNKKYKLVNITFNNTVIVNNTIIHYIDRTIEVDDDINKSSVILIMVLLWCLYRKTSESSVIANVDRTL